MVEAIIDIDTNDLLRIGTILVSVAIVLSPILDPKHSLFTRRAEKGIEILEQVRDVEKDIHLCYLEDDETGFNEVVEASQLIFDLNGPVERICLAVGSPEDLGEYTGFGMKYGIGKMVHYMPRWRMEKKNCFGGMHGIQIAH